MLMVYVFSYKHLNGGGGRGEHSHQLEMEKFRFSSKHQFGRLPKRKLSDWIAVIFSSENTMQYI